MPALNIFPENHELKYEVAASRHEGELTLGRIAAQSNREYLWTYDEGQDLWINNAVDHYVEREYKLDKIWRFRHGATIPSHLIIPSGPDRSMYHNHPTAPESFEHPEIKAQLPSDEDIEACARLCINVTKIFESQHPWE